MKMLIKLFEVSANSKTRQISPLVHKIQNFKYLLPNKKYCKSTDYTDRVKKIIKNRTEDKILFGKLIETNIDKKKRLKKGEIIKSKSKSSNEDSEFSWVVGNSKHLQILSVTKNSENIYQNENKKSIKSFEQEKTDKTIDQLSKTDDLKINVNDNVNDNKPKIKSKVKLSEVLIQYLPQYPIFDKKESVDIDIFEKSEIMSVSPNENKAVLHYPSVTRILSATMSEEAKAVLERWKKNMIAKLGLKGFEKYQAALLADGRCFHEAIFYKLREKYYDVPDKIKKSVSSLDEVLSNIPNVKAMESHVIHPHLQYRGIVDCIAVYRDDLCLIDWKKSDKPKSTLESTYDAPLQLASYIGAINADSTYPFKIKRGLVIVAYTNGDPATVHEISNENLEKYWKQWLQRLQEYHIGTT